MTVTDFMVLLPLVMISATLVAILVATAFRRNHTATTVLTLMGLAAAFGLIFVARFVGPRQITPILIIDGYACFYMGLLFATSFAVAALSHGYLEGREGRCEEFYILLLLATLGTSVLVASNHFVSFFLGLELLSVALYVMIAYLRTRKIGIEAGIKYLILAALSAAFLLFGMALVYAQLGTMGFASITSLLTVGGASSDLVVLTGLAMMVVGVGFKLAVVPFHMWTPDVYEGAPAPVTAFVATASKGAMFALLLRYGIQVDIYAYRSFTLLLGLIAVGSMFAGNLLALRQDNVKRLLAYSSIAHLGYLLVAFLAGGPRAVEAVTFYLTAYFVTTLGAFGVITVASPKDRDKDDLEEYRGLGWRQPWLAGTFTAMLLSLAGIPLTAGFVGKFLVVAAGVGSALWILVVVLVVNSAIGLFYYLRIVVAMYMHPAEEETEAAVATASPISLAEGVIMATLMVLLIGLGIYPAPLIHMIQTTVTCLF